ncbi:hypothetical protein, partial [Bacillus paralicheniformis]|uniref:hypothetical protein n=1 Tax=Bacillus paralicheniformis TaxID=1648923 RepID=UPI002DB8B495
MIPIGFSPSIFQTDIYCIGFDLSLKPLCMKRQKTAKKHPSKTDAQIVDKILKRFSVLGFCHPF